MDASLSRYVDHLQQQASRATNAEVPAAAVAPGKHAGPAKAPPSIDTFLVVDNRPIEWLWPGWLPLGKITLLDGAANIGKSLFLLDLAARVSRGGRMPDGSLGGTGAVVLMAAHDGCGDTIRPRLEAAQADLGCILNASALSLPADLGQLERLIAERDVKLCIIDPLGPFLAGIRPRKALPLLGKIAEARRCAVVCIGGGDQAGPARAGLLLAADPDDEEIRVLSAPRTNLTAPPRPLRFRFEQAGSACRITWQGVFTRIQGRSKLDLATELLAELLAPGPMKITTCKRTVAEAGCSSRTVDRAAQRLNLQLVHTTGADGSHLFAWELPEKNMLPNLGEAGVQPEESPICHGVTVRQAPSPNSLLGEQVAQDAVGDAVDGQDGGVSTLHLGHIPNSTFS